MQSSDALRFQRQRLNADRAIVTVHGILLGSSCRSTRIIWSMYSIASLSDMANTLMCPTPISTRVRAVCVELAACCVAGCLLLGSLGYGDRLWLGEEATEHPIDAPEGADATLLLADGSSAAAAAAAAVGASGAGGGRGRGRAPAVEGVHGDKHLAEDEYARTVQVRHV